MPPKVLLLLPVIFACDFGPIARTRAPSWRPQLRPAAVSGQFATIQPDTSRRCPLPWPVPWPGAVAGLQNQQRPARIRGSLTYHRRFN